MQIVEPAQFRKLCQRSSIASVGIYTKMPKVHAKQMISESRGSEQFARKSDWWQASEADSRPFAHVLAQNDEQIRPRSVAVQSVPGHSSLTAIAHLPLAIAFSAHTQPSLHTITKPHIARAVFWVLFTVDADPPIERLRTPATPANSLRFADRQPLDICSAPSTTSRNRFAATAILHLNTHQGAARRNARKHVVAIAAKALGDERRRDKCLGWCVFATRDSAYQSS